METQTVLDNNSHESTDSYEENENTFFEENEDASFDLFSEIPLENITKGSCILYV